MAVAGVVILVDGAQAVLANALRARGDVWPTTLIQIACFWLCMAPSAWLLAFEADLGPTGLVLGIGCGTGLSAVLLAAALACARAP